MLGERIRLLRTTRGISQVALAQRFGVTKQCVSNWENDNILPSIEMLKNIALYFSVSTDYLLEMDERKYIEVSGLTDEQLDHIRCIIDDIRQK